MELSIKIQTQITILKLIKLEPKKKSKADPSERRWEDMQWCFLNALE